MTRILLIGAVLAAATLAGCATGTQGAASNTSATSTSSSANGRECNSDLAESAVGQKADAKVLESYRKEAGARLARILRPRDVITMEYNPQRLNLRVDEQDVVISVNCS